MSSLHSIFIRPAVPPKPRGPQTHVPATELSHHGIHATLNRFAARLRAKDDELAADLEDKGLETTFYAFRWFTCLAPGGLGLPDTIRLWDSLFADWCLEQENVPVEGDMGFRFLEDFGLAILLYPPTSTPRATGLFADVVGGQDSEGYAFGGWIFGEYHVIAATTGE